MHIRLTALGAAIGVLLCLTACTKPTDSADDSATTTAAQQSGTTRTTATTTTTNGTPSSTVDSSVSATTTTTTPRPQPNWESNIPTPAVAQQAGCTELLFWDEFDSPVTIDYSGKGRPGYNWYIDRPYGLPTLTTSDFSVEDSVLTIKPAIPSSSFALSTYSAKGDTGFTWHYGYAEARIRFNTDSIPTAADGRLSIPSFWGLGVTDIKGERWSDCGELDIMEVFMRNSTDREGGAYYGGALHHHHRPNPSSNTKEIATNLINANGYGGTQYLPDSNWHVYSALWTENYIAWYIDGKFMHAVEFGDDELPTFWFRGVDEPLPSTATNRNWVGAHTVMNNENLVLILGGDALWQSEVDWVRVWGFPETE